MGQASTVNGTKHRCDTVVLNARRVPPFAAQTLQILHREPRFHRSPAPCSAEPLERGRSRLRLERFVRQLSEATAQQRAVWPRR